MWVRMAGWFASARWRAFVIPATLVALLTIGVSVAQADITLQNSDCWSCHDPRYHVDEGSEYINCNNGCHDGWGVNSFLDIYSGDHGGNTSPSNPTFDCTFCHNPSYPGVPQHDGAELEVMHETTTDPFGTCAGCHDSALITEHGDDCALCHSSSDPDVVAAIGAGDTDCGACHDVDAAHGPLHDGGFTDPSCALCHESNTSLEHADNCALCHESTDPVVVAAIAANDVTCGACHDVSMGHDAAHDGVTGSPACLDCHGGSLVGTHGGTCGVCHLSTQPEVIEVISAGGATCGSCHPGGHYRGASLDAYLKWAGAKAIMTANGVDASLQNTPHGGYTANTTKCAL